jgi:UDP-N-acetylmuramate dehydrogenase
MNILQNVSLAAYSTMGLGGSAKYLVEITSRGEVREALDWARAKALATVMIGGGSNIIWQDTGFPGLVMIDKILGYDLRVDNTTDDVYLTLGSGEPWDSVVERSVAAGLTGIEALSLIPGSAGATPVQNVGAYGQEIAQTLVTIEAFDTQAGGDGQAGDFVTLRASDCAFGYRTSRFKTTDRGRFYITGITLQLTQGKPLPPFYGALQTYLEARNITEYTPASIREAVIAIRSSKLPDPAVIHNTGSFFGNPIISDTEFSKLLKTSSKQTVRPTTSETGISARDTDNPAPASAPPYIPHWPLDNGSVKLSAAWLIEQVGFKNYDDPETGMATWPQQSLVLVNKSAHSTADLLKFKQKIIDAVRAKFNITLQQEPELLP